MDNKNKEYEDTIIFLVEQITQRLDKTLIYSQNINDFIESQRQAGTVYEQNIQQLNDTLAERDQSIQQLNHTLAERDQSIQQLNHTLAERDQSIQQLNDTLAERDQSIQQLNHTLAEHDQSIQQLNDTLAERDQSIQQLEQEVLFYATSKSWKITRPLRKVVNFFKRSISKASS